MTRSVRAGGFAAAAFLAAFFGGAVQAQTAPADVAAVQTTVAQAAPAPAVAVTPAVLTTVAQAPGAVQAAPQQAPAAPAEAAPAPAAPAVPLVVPGQSLEQLTAALAATEVSNVDHECLATAVYFEARGEPLAGQLAVAEVVLNRAKSGRYPPDVCAVVKQPWQFSFVRKGQFPPADRSSEAWKKSVAISKIALDKLAAKLPRTVLWYHADYVAPSWGKRLTRQTKIGAHIFYS